MQLKVNIQEYHKVEMLEILFISKVNLIVPQKQFLIDITLKIFII